MVISMTRRNIHGDWTMSFHNRILRSAVIGSTNQEASKAWLNELKAMVTSSAAGVSEPWVMLIDGSLWEMSPDEVWDTNNEFVAWVMSNNCIFLAFVLSKKIQSFALEKGLNDQSVINIYFDYDEANLACLAKLND